MFFLWNCNWNIYSGKSSFFRNKRGPVQSHSTTYFTHKTSALSLFFSLKKVCVYFLQKKSKQKQEVVGKKKRKHFFLRPPSVHMTAMISAFYLKIFIGQSIPTLLNLFYTLNLLSWALTLFFQGIQVVLSLLATIYFLSGAIWPDSSAAKALAKLLVFDPVDEELELREDFGTERWCSLSKLFSVSSFLIFAVALGC